MCGKNFDRIGGIKFDLGSPPRVREKLLDVVFEIVELGITPACAGKTSGGIWLYIR